MEQKIYEVRNAYKKIHSKFSLLFRNIPIFFRSLKSSIVFATLALALAHILISVCVHFSLYFRKLIKIVVLVIASGCYSLICCGLHASCHTCQWLFRLPITVTIHRLTRERKSIIFNPVVKPKIQVGNYVGMQILADETLRKNGNYNWVLSFFLLIFKSLTEKLIFWSLQ